MIRDMTKGSEIKHILIFFVPTLFSNLFQQLYALVDIIVVGQFSGTKALAGVGAAYPAILLVLSLAIGVAQGGATVIGQYFGAGKHDELKKIISTFTISAFIGSFILAIGGLLLSGFLVDITQVPEESITPALEYMNIMFLGIPLMVFYNLYREIMYAMGNARSPIVFLILASILNAVLDIIFVAVFNWGVAGAAWATVISQFLCSASCVIYALYKIPLLKFNKGEFRFHKEYFQTILKLGIVRGLQYSAASVGMVIMQSFVNGLGVATIAAFRAVESVTSAVVYLPIQNLAQSFKIFTSQNIGADLMKRIKKALFGTLCIGIAISIFTSILLLFFSDNIMNLFISQNETGRLEVIAKGTAYLQTIAVFYIIYTATQIINDMMYGAGEVKLSALSSAATIVSRLVFAIFLIPFIHDRGIWISVPIGWGIGFIITLYAYIKGRWKNSHIVKRQKIQENIE
ncbi:MAG: family efflux transporter [Clostridia bacterium]|nr:family efflux transporter [Clostridia bacterium]